MICSLTVEVKERPICKVCNKNVVKRHKKIYWATKCVSCYRRQRTPRNTPRPMCSSCGLKPVTSRGLGSWRNKCWKCDRPNRIDNARARQLKRQQILTDCVRCGSAENIEIDHKDGDRHNNALDNLQCLCKDCHFDKTMENKEYLPLEKRKIKMSA